jgi:hypothetical protein
MLRSCEWYRFFRVSEFRGAAPAIEWLSTDHCKGGMCIIYKCNRNVIYYDYGSVLRRCRVGQNWVKGITGLVSDRYITILCITAVLYHGKVLCKFEKKKYSVLVRYMIVPT